MDDESIFIKEWKTIGMIVSQFNALELLITKILTKFISPNEQRKDFVQRQLLNNSVISFGAKVKLLISITKSYDLGKVDRNKLHRILSLRNAIAHNDVVSNLKIHVPEDPDESVSQYFVIDKMKSDGNLETMDKSETYWEFMNLNEELNAQLQKIYENL